MSSAVKPYQITPRRHVPASVPRPPYVDVMTPEHYDGDAVMSPEIIEKMRIAGRIAADSILVAASQIAPGVTTDHLDKVAHEFMCDHGAYPATLGYMGFKKSICTSVNEVICHGIPDQRPLEEGDIVKIDSTAYIHGVHGDNCATFFVGEVDESSRLLTERTREAMNRGIKAVSPGRTFNVIGKVIEAYAHRFGYDSVREYTGHGVHTAFHSGLIVLHYDSPYPLPVIKAGMTFTIEPMLALGSARNEQWNDGWTVVTKDKSRVAQFEQTLVANADGSTEILTLPSSGMPITGGDPSKIDLSDIH